MGSYIFIVLVLWLGYMGVLFIWDADAGGLEALQHAGSVMAGMTSLAFFSYFIRYVRWLAMFRARNIKWPFWGGFVCYLSGFAFTVTPGKIGELSRVRYFSMYGVSSRSVVSGFFYERCLDLLTVLLLAMMFFTNSTFYPVALLFVLTIVSAVLACVILSSRIRLLAKVLLRVGCRRTADLMSYASRVGHEIKGWCQWDMLAQGACLGLTAWVCTALSLVWLLASAELLVDVPLIQAFALYPFAMLAGAASMMPGGIGATEAVLAVSLESLGVEVSVAVICAMVTRLATMWFSVMLGFICVGILEYRRISAR